MICVEIMDLIPAASLSNVYAIKEGIYCFIRILTKVPDARLSVMWTRIGKTGVLKGAESQRYCPSFNFIGNLVVANLVK
jgi:hypothetical protein